MGTLQSKPLNRHLRLRLMMGTLISSHVLLDGRGMTTKPYTIGQWPMGTLVSRKSGPFLPHGGTRLLISFGVKGGHVGVTIK